MRRSRVARHVPWAAAALLVSSCGPSPDSDRASDPGGWDIASEPRVSVGGYGDDPAYLLDGVVGATLLADGRLAILDRGSSELRYFDSDGRHVRSVAGPGDGPGELRFPMQLVRLPGDSLMALGVRSGMTWFDPSGEYVRSRRVNWFEIGDQRCRLGEGGTWGLPDGSVLVVLEDNFYPRGCPPQPEGVWRQSGLIGLQRWGPSPSFDTLAIVPATERNGDNYRVFGLSLLTVASSTRLYTGDTGADSISVLGLDGTPQGSIASPHERRPVPAAARELRERQWTREDGSTEYGDPFDYPERYPSYAQLLVDALGNLWVKEYPEVLEPLSSPQFASVYGGFVQEGGARWAVLAEDGTVVQRLRTPAGLFVLEVGQDYVLGVARDPLGVETVQLHGLNRGSGSF